MTLLSVALLMRMVRGDEAAIAGMMQSRARFKVSILCQHCRAEALLVLVQGDEAAIASMLQGDGRVLANALDENRRRYVLLVLAAQTLNAAGHSGHMRRKQF